MDQDSLSCVMEEDDSFRTLLEDLVFHMFYPVYMTFAFLIKSLIQFCTDKL